MSDHKEHTAEKIFSNIMETIADNIPKQKSGRFFEGDSSTSAQMKKLFGRQNTLHKVLGGGKPADVLLWRNKKISSSVLVGATIIWIIFEWLNYHLLTLVAFALVIGMLVQFVWSNASGVLNSSPPRFNLPEDLFVNLAVSIGAQVIASLFAAAIVGGWCNFLTVIYVGFVSAHTLPVLYEKYEDEVDDFVYKFFGQLQNHYRKLDSSILSKIPKGNLSFKKKE